MERVRNLTLLFILFAFAVSCSKPFVKEAYSPLAMSKTAAEGIALTAKHMQAEGIITMEQLEKVREVYQRGSLAQDAVIDAIKVAIEAGADPMQDADYIKAMREFVKASEELYLTAVEYKILTPFWLGPRK